MDPRDPMPNDDPTRHRPGMGDGEPAHSGGRGNDEAPPLSEEAEGEDVQPFESPVGGEHQAHVPSDAESSTAEREAARLRELLAGREALPGQAGHFDAAAAAGAGDTHTMAGTGARRIGLLTHSATTQQLLLLGWCVWLLAAWLLMWWMHATLPAIRWMLIIGAVGMLALWPAVRLSQGQVYRFAWMRQRATAGQTLGDWLSMNAIFQAVIWLLYWAGTRPELDSPPGVGGSGWVAMQTLQISIAVLGWSLWCGLLIWVGLQFASAVARLLVMAGCLALLLAEPAVMAALNLLAATGTGPGDAGWHWRWTVNPLGMLWSLSIPAGARDAPPGAGETARVLAVLAGAVVGWLSVWLWSLQRTRQAKQAASHPGEPPGGHGSG